jgi:hypothetical protein
MANLTLKFKKEGKAPSVKRQSFDSNVTTPWRIDQHKIGLGPEKAPAKHYFRIIPAFGDSDNWSLIYKSFRVYGGDKAWSGELAFDGDRTELTEAGLLFDAVTKELRRVFGVTKRSVKGRDYLALPDNLNFLQLRPRLAFQVLPVKSTYVKDNKPATMDTEFTPHVCVLPVTPYPGAKEQVGTQLLNLEQEVDDEDNLKYGSLVDPDAGYLIKISTSPNGPYYDYTVAVEKPYPIVDGEKFTSSELEKALSRVKEIEQVIQYTTAEEVASVLTSLLQPEHIDALQHATSPIVQKYFPKLRRSEEDEELEVTENEPY